VNYQQKTKHLATAALILSLTTACTSINTAPVGKKTGPQAPGTVFDGELQASTTASTPVVPGTSAGAQATSVEQAQVPPTAPAPGRIDPRHKYVNVRPAPSTNNKPIAVLMGGKKVEVLGTEGSWTKIRWKRGTKVSEGWVAGKFVDAGTAMH
jgi:uncharacterized protein YgiM (DUF1202 family)